MPCYLTDSAMSMICRRGSVMDYMSSAFNIKAEKTPHQVVNVVHSDNCLRIYICGVLFLFD